MDSEGRGQEELSDGEEFSINSITVPDTATTIQRLKEFTYHLVEEIEVNLEFCLKLLEERKVPVKPNSKYVFVLSKIASAVPKVGSGIGAAVSQGETFFLNRVDKKNSRALADLVYYFSDNRESFRRILIEAAVDIFCSFEIQFMKLTCDGGEKRAMLKLAKNAGGKIFGYFLEKKQGKDLTKKDVVEGIMQGGAKSERTVKTKEKNWKTSKIYTKTGLFVAETGQFFKNKSTNPEKYGHRKSFQWETLEEIEKTFEVDTTPYEIPQYSLVLSEELIDDIRKYIMSKDPFEEAKLERENYNIKLLEVTSKDHDEVLHNLNEHFQEVLQEMADQFAVTKSQQETQITMLETVLQNQEEDKNSTVDINLKLDVIHKDVQDTKENQNVIINTTTEIKEDVTAIKATQMEIANSVVRHEEVEKMIKEEADKHKIGNELNRILRNNDPGPSIKKEVERSAENIKKEFNRFK